MNVDEKRKPGFYWVRFEGEVQVAEWTRLGSWVVTGSDRYFTDAEVCELLSGKLECNGA